jgi:uncharacterized protein (DUF1684 family)
MTLIPDPLGFADWRRRTGELYAAVRAQADAGAAWNLWRRERARLFREHAHSPIEPARRHDYSGRDYFDYAPGLRFQVGVEAPGQAAGQSWDLGEDGVITLHPAGCTHGLADALGAELVLFWIGGYGGGLFLPFSDASAGGETYGGGRYLLDTIKGADLGMADGRLVLDFNFAYNPSCAYAPHWTCPLAPPENRLPVAVRGGERTPSA